MNLSRSQKLWHSVGLAALCGILLAPKAGLAEQELQIPARPEWSQSQQKDARRLLQLAHTQDVYKTPLTLKVENATLEEVAKQVHASLPPKAMAPPIEVRGVKPVRLSFSVKDSTAAGVLNSAATLAGARLWFFEDHVLLAANGSLSKEELASHTQGFNSFWSSQTPEWNPQGEINKRKILCSVVTHEIEGLTANSRPDKTGTAATIAPGASPTSGKVKVEEIKMGADTVRVQTTTIGQLSPDAQAILQELVANANAETSRMDKSQSAVIPHITFSPDAVVELRSEGDGFLSVGTPKQGRVSWSLNGQGVSFGSIVPMPRPQGSSALPTPFLDPSAGKS